MYPTLDHRTQIENFLVTGIFNCNYMKALILILHDHISEFEKFSGRGSVISDD